MGWSGLIYAAIVAGWAAVLVPRWVRRNEEAERAKAADALAGIRVLERRRRSETASPDQDDRTPRRPVLHAPHPPLHDLPPRLVAASRDERGSVRLPGALPRTAVAASPSSAGAPSRTSPSARRRRVLAVLTAVLVLTVVAVVAGLLGAGWIAAPVLLLVAFVVLARAAVRREATAARRRRGRVRSPGQHREAAPVGFAPPERRTTAAGQGAARMPDTASDPADAGAAHAPSDVVDGSWDPVPVPLPTYVTAPRAPRVIRRIDLSAPGAWTSGGALPPADRPVPAAPLRSNGGFPSLPPVVGVEPAATAERPEPADDEGGGFEHRPAVGD